jgi:hypothetical protein
MPIVSSWVSEAKKWFIERLEAPAVNGAALGAL